MLDQVRVAVLQPQVELQARVLAHHAREHRQQELAPQHDGQVHPQQAGHFFGGAGSLGLQRVELGEQALAALEQALAVGRQAHLARGAVEQLHLERLLEPRDGLGVGGGDGAQLARGRGEAAVLGGFGKGHHLLQGVLHGWRIEDRLPSM